MRTIPIKENYLYNLKTIPKRQTIMVLMEFIEIQETGEQESENHFIIPIKGTYNEIFKNSNQLMHKIYLLTKNNGMITKPFALCRKLRILTEEEWDKISKPKKIYL